jgi:hypothetical protein
MSNGNPFSGFEVVSLTWTDGRSDFNGRFLGFRTIINDLHLTVVWKNNLCHRQWKIKGSCSWSWQGARIFDQKRKTGIKGTGSEGVKKA